MPITSNAKQIADKLARDLTPMIEPAMVGLATLAAGKLSHYPPATEANTPTIRRDSAGRRYIRWYQRGYGPKRQRLRDGAIIGKKTSQSLGRSWSVTPQPMGAIISNGSDYSAVVHRDPKSSKKPSQARFHGRRGWITDRESVRRVLLGGYLQKVLGNVISRIVQ